MARTKGRKKDCPKGALSRGEKEKSRNKLKGGGRASPTGVKRAREGKEHLAVKTENYETHLHGK